MHQPRPATFAVLAVFALAGSSASARAAGDSWPVYEWHNGEAYRIEKRLEAEGREVKLYHGSGGVFTPEALRAHVAAQPARVISAELDAALAGSEPLPVVITLREQPGAPLSREVRAASRAQRESLTAQMRAIADRANPAARAAAEGRLIPVEEKRGLRVEPLTAEEQARLVALGERLDEITTRDRQELYARLQAAVAPSQEAVVKRIGELGGTVTARITVVNSIAATLSPEAIRALAQDPAVAGIDPDRPGAPELDTSTGAIGAPSFWTAGFTGAPFDVAILDTGVNGAHPAFAGKTFLTNITTTITNAHGTQMAGIMAGIQAPHIGVAHGADTVVAGLAGSDSTSMTGMNYIASTGQPEACNYSFGNGTASSNDYANIDRFFDGVISTFGYMVSKSTGNGGFGSGTPTITHPAPAFNLVAVANLDNTNDSNRSNDRINSSSSRGPTVAGRKKPDIGAPGTGIMSPNLTNTYTSSTGTSPAAPHVGASFLLLMSSGITDLAAIKAILINNADAMEDNATSSTTDDAFVNGSRWNRRYGWGYVNLNTAFLNAPFHAIGSVPGAPENADFRLYTTTLQANEKVTLVWERVVAYNGATYPTIVENLNDLDLRIYRVSDGAQAANSSSAVDNVEQASVILTAPYVVKVEGFSAFDPQVPVQEFAIAMQEAFAPATGPELQVTVDPAPSAAPGGTVTMTATIRNTGDLPAYAINATLSGVFVPAGAGVLAGTLQPGQDTQVSWIASAPFGVASHPVVVTASSVSFGETFAASGSGSVIVRCIADIAAVGGTAQGPGTPDQQLTVDDIITFVGLVSDGTGCPGDAPCSLADVCGIGGTSQPPDGQLSVDDVIAFINAFSDGC